MRGLDKITPGNETYLDTVVHPDGTIWINEQKYVWSWTVMNRGRFTVLKANIGQPNIVDCSVTKRQIRQAPERNDTGAKVRQLKQHYIVSYM